MSSKSGQELRRPVPKPRAVPRRPARHNNQVRPGAVRRHTVVVAAVRCDVETVGTRLLAHVTGDLSVATAPRLRMALFKCLMEQPDAVVVDLAGLTLSEPQAFRVFAVVARQAGMWPGTPLLLSAVP